MPERFLASVLPQHEAAELYRLMVVGIREVAEYVSDASILAELRAIGVDFAQGYCIGKPRPLSA